MFPDEYIRYITNLPVEPLENISETTLIKWSILQTLNRDTIPIMTGCKFEKYCRIGPQCPYLHPQMEIYNSTLGQVTHTRNNNVKILYIDSTEEKKTRRIPSPPSKRDSRSRRQKIQSLRRSRSQMIRGQRSDGSRTPTFKRQRSIGLKYQEYDCHQPWIR